MAHRDDPVKQLSKRVFNSLHLLTVATSISAEGDNILSHEDVIDLSGSPRTAVYNELQLLTSLGVLQRVELSGRVGYQRVDSPFWLWCDELVESASVRQLAGDRD